MRTRQYLMVLLSVCVSGLSSATVADENSVPTSEKLRQDQEAVSGRYARFERLLSQMADMLGHEDPERAELLRRAISKGREQAIAPELDVIARTLGEGNYGKAREKQVGVTKSLEALLQLLQSEDRRSSVEKEHERLNNILKDVRNTIAEERAARGAAQNSTAPSNAAPQQKKALNQADEILKGIQQHDDAQQQAAEDSSESAADGKGQNQPSADSKSGDQKAGESESKSGDSPSESGSSEKGSESEGKGQKSDKSSDGKPQDGKSESAEEKSPADGQDSDAGKADEKDPKSDGKPGKPGDEPKSGMPAEDSESSESQGIEGQPSEESKKSQKSQPGSPSQGKSGQQSEQEEEESEQTPGRQQLESARNLMQEALEQLGKQEREKAVDRQDEAIAELQKAAQELEEMLKQLREEEKEMVLAALEARFQRLLALQTQIHETTVDLAATPRKDWLDNAISQCRELSQQQQDLTRECSQTTGLLREDGTSVSILVAVEDIESDMGRIASRLQETKVQTLTQSMQTDVIEALKELIAATQREMEEMKSQQRQQQQQQSSDQEKPPLVELMAEIRVLRSLQLRVNRRTKQVHQLLQENDPSAESDLNDQLAELADRQHRLRESAAELAAQLEKQR